MTPKWVVGSTTFMGGLEHGYRLGRLDDEVVLVEIGDGHFP